MSLLLFAIKLSGVIIIGSIVYYYSGVLKILSSATVEELNDSELSITEEGELQEEFPEEIISPNEAKTMNYIATILFITIGSITWISVGVICGNVAYLCSPSEVFKLLVYFLIYILLLRFPFGVVNKTIQKTYELEIIPEKIIFAMLMITSYLYGINFFDSMPSFIKDFLQ